MKQEHHLIWRPSDDGDGEWQCACGTSFGHSITLGWRHLGVMAS